MTFDFDIGFVGAGNMGYALAKVKVLYYTVLTRYQVDQLI